MQDLVVKNISRNDYLFWIKERHYAKTVPSISYSFGLFLKDVMIGVCTFGTPFSSTLKKAIGDDFKLIELNRLVTEDGLKKNALSFFVSSCLKFLKKYGPFVVISYADTKQGHNGYIYQATNFVYTGLSAKRTDWKIKGLEKLHGGTIADISRGVQNRAEYMRRTFGDSFYLEQRSRKHRYFYFIGSKKQKAKMKSILPYDVLPYPKGKNSNYNLPENKYQQLRLF